MSAVDPPPSAPGPRDGVTRAVSIRDLCMGDLDAVTVLHRTAFPTNVHGRLGRRFLRAYLHSFLDSPYAVAWVAAGGRGKPVGFLVGILDTAQHRRHVRHRHMARLAPATALGLLRHPRLSSVLVLRRIGLRLARWRRGREPAGSAGSGATPAGPVAVLSHVAVAETARGSGLGSLLVERFEEAARSSGAQRACLATLADDDGAGDFYRARGWTLETRRRTADGRMLELYELPVGTGTGSAAE